MITILERRRRKAFFKLFLLMDQRDGLTAALNVNRLRALVAHFKAGRLISKSCWTE